MAKSRDSIRKYLSSDEWLKEKPFSKACARLDIAMNGHLFSLREYQARWGWKCKSTVWRFIKNDEVLKTFFASEIETMFATDSETTIATPNNLKISKDTSNRETASATKNETVPATGGKTNKSIDFAAFITYFNKTFEGTKIPQIHKLDDARKAALTARVKDYGKEVIPKLFEKAKVSNMLNGMNNRGWVANFDFLFSPSGFRKTLEGNYDNRERISEKSIANDDVARTVFDYESNPQQEMEREREIQKQREHLRLAKSKEVERTPLLPGHTGVPGSVPDTK